MTLDQLLDDFQTGIDRLIVECLGDEVAQTIIEAKPTGPLTPKQGRARAERMRKAQARVRDVQASNNIKLRAARRRLGDI